MTGERFRQIRNVFDAALERDPSARVAFLEEACHGDDELRREIEELLHARDQKTGWLDADAETSVGRLEGRRIGPYEVLRALGEGGMGTVYLAARADGAFRKLVALKVVRPQAATTEVLRRFQQEREILASMDHPNIARIIDGGETADGLPYLVMEYVEGKPIDGYCDERRLSVTERLELFDQVCSAIRYAHTKQVVHRDLKPSNILVTADGQVKLLDFGIAKLLANDDDITLLRTRSDLRLMTPEYASPEQVRGESVTALSDVYSLGVLLYELLTGRRPYRLQSRILHEVVRIICEEPPTRPSTAVTQRNDAEDGPDSAPEALSRMRQVSPQDLRRKLAGDLDGILLKSLEKDPQERYKSVAELCEDLQNHLHGESVRARRSAGLQAARTFAQRNPWLILAVVAFALAAWNGWIPAVALFIGATTLVSFPIGFWIVSREFGGGFAPPSIVRMTLKNIAVWGVVVFAVFSLLRQAGHLDFETTMELIMAGMAIWALYLFVRWPMRKRLLGPLLLDLSRAAHWGFFVIFGVAAALALTRVIFVIDELKSVQISRQFIYFHVANRPPGTAQSGYEDTSLPLNVYRTMGFQRKVFSNVIAFAPLAKVTPKSWSSLPVRFKGKLWQAFGEEVSGDLFSTLNIPPHLGQEFSKGDEFRQSPVAVLSYDSWTRQFGSNPAVIGQPLYVKGIPFTIIGVAPPGFRGIDPHHVMDFWIPLQDRVELYPWGVSPITENYSLYGVPDWYCLSLLGRLRPGITEKEAMAKLTPAFRHSLITHAFASDESKPQLYFSPAVGIEDWTERAARNRNILELRSLLAQLLNALILLVICWLGRRVEIRAQGLAAAGVFIRWRRIVGYSWESKLGKFEMLRLRLNGPLRWSPLPVRMLVNRNLRPQVDALLKQQLMEWPT